MRGDWERVCDPHARLANDELVTNQGSVRARAAHTRSLSVLSLVRLCVSLLCDPVTSRPASTHTALVSQPLIGLCFAFPSICLARQRGQQVEHERLSHLA